MRFATTFQDQCLRVCGAVYVCIMPFIYFTAPGADRTTLHERVIAWAVWGLMLVAMLPHYYEIREDGLLLRLRWRRRLIPYASLVEVWDRPDRTNVRFAAVSLVRVTTDSGNRYTFGVEEKGRFLDELGRRSPRAVRA
jgi:hypothetical protein